MAYTIDAKGDLVIGGFDKGIGDSPYTGLTDLRSVDPLSIPGEVSVSYATTPVFKNPMLSGNTTGSLVTTSSGLFLAPSNLLLEGGQYITFSNLGGATGSGLSTGVTYVLSHFGTSAPNDQWQLYTLANAAVTVTLNSSSTVTFSTINPSQPNYMVYDGSYHWMLDSNGYLWSDIVTTIGGGGTTATHSWTWTQNNVTSAHGNGLTYLKTPNTSNSIGDTWIFIFRDQAIDYGPVVAAAYPVWVNGWNPNTGTSSNSTQMQNTNYHQAMVGPDGNLYFINSSASAKLSGSIGKLQVNFGNSSYTAFTPSSTPSVSNYSYTDYPLIPKFDFATCLAPSGTNILIGGKKNYVYNWDTFSTLVANYIFVAEKNIQTIVTANQSSFIFAGNLGNIYITNGSQADVWKKFPDHLTGTLYPIYTFYGATYQKGRLYFGISAVAQTGGGYLPIGGAWYVDLMTKALVCSNQLSYGNYNGYASCFLPGDVTNNVPPGSGLYIGWSDASGSNFGVDAGVSTPYTNGASYIVSDLIPVGTALNPMTAYQAEFKTSCPLALNESVQLLMGSSLYDYTNNNLTSVGTINGTAGPYTVSDGTNPQVLSGNLPITVQKQQWLLLQAILTSTASTPSQNRITELRIIGDTVKSMIAGQPYQL